MPGLRGVRVLIWGLGRHGGGLAAARLCAAEGARVEILDGKPAQECGSDGPAALAEGFACHVGDATHPAFRDAELIVPSPAIPPRAWPASHPPVASPEALALERHRGRRVGVTGTKGKSTTAMLAGALLGWRVAGNSWRPLCEAVLADPAADLVCELSSFQLWYLYSGASPLRPSAYPPGFVEARSHRHEPPGTWADGLRPSYPPTASRRPPHRCATGPLDNQPPRFDAAILTLLATDHLDWHPDVAHYRAAKLALPAWSDAVAAAAQAVPLLPAGLALLPLAAEPEPGAMRVPGPHNRANAALAIAVARHLGVAAGDIAPRLAAAEPLPHRLRTVHSRAGIDFVDDSIATTPEASMAGITSFTGPLAVILGGSDKGADYQALAAAVARRGARPVLLGQTAPRIRACLAAVGIDAPVAATIDDAVARAAQAVVGGGTVLLSPACASFDLFRGFDHRGDCFAAAARGLSP